MRNLDATNATLTIELKQGRTEAIARFKTDEGKIATKTIAVADLIAELSRDLEITTGVLPGGTRFYSGTKSVYRIGIQVPAKVRTADFTLHDVGPKRITVPFPEMLFVFSIREKRISDSTLFACIPPIGRAHDRLYFFPFGNVWEDGRICWGSVHQPQIEEPIVLDTMVTRFFSSAFSGHLVHGSSMFNPPEEGIVNLRTLLEHLSGQEHFPDRILKASNTTLGSAMSERHKQGY